MTPRASSSLRSHRLSTRALPLALAMATLAGCSSSSADAPSGSVDGGGGADAGAGDDGSVGADGASNGSDAGITQTKDCAPNPHLCGFPDATNTGVPQGMALQRVPEDVTSGPGWTWEAKYEDLRVDTAGAVIEGLDINGNIEVYANNVTIKNCRITASGETWGVGLRHANDVTLENLTISSPVQDGAERLLVGVKDIYGDTSGAVVRRCDIAHTSTGIQFCNGLVEDVYVHDMGFVAGDHTNGFTSNAGCDSLTVKHSTFFNQRDQTDAISLFQDFGVQKNAVIDNNLVAGGGYCIYGGGDGSFGVSSNIQITNNRVAKLYSDNGGGFGWLAHYDDQGPGNVLSGNVWDVDDAPLP